MIGFAMLPMPAKTVIATVLFLTMCTGVCTTALVGRKQGIGRLILLGVSTAAVFAMLVLYASVIPAERAKPVIPDVSVWFAQLPVAFTLLVWLAAAVCMIVVVADECRRRHAVTDSSVKESLDHLETGLCFSHPNGLVMLTNHRMNQLSHAIFGRPLQNANLFWEALANAEPAEGVRRMAGGDRPEFCLPDESVWTFRREMLDSAVQLTAADTTQQHQMVEELEKKNRALEAMNARIRSYGDKVDEYVIARERLETRVNLHGFLGQALLMTRHYLQYETGSPQKIIDIWQRNIDVLRMEAEPQQNADTLASLKNAAKAIGMEVHIRGHLPDNAQFRTLIASIGAETLTNAVRHARARQLWIEAEQTEHAYFVRYTNDGADPTGPVTEGGGLGNARRKVEAAGGRMQIDIAPRFMLTIIFEKEASPDV